MIVEIQDLNLHAVIPRVRGMAKIDLGQDPEVIGDLLLLKLSVDLDQCLKIYLEVPVKIDLGHQEKIGQEVREMIDHEVLGMIDHEVLGMIDQEVLVKIHVVL